jgi:hypothetical protein
VKAAISEHESMANAPTLEQRTLGLQEPDPLILEYRTGLNLDHAERAIALLGNDQLASRRVVLRFLEYPYVLPGAGSRLGNALRRYSGGPLHVEAPPFNDGKDRWFRSFTQSYLGDAIATHAAVIISDGADVTNQLRTYYSDRTQRQSQNSVVQGALHGGLTVDPEREDLFRDSFLRSLLRVNVRPTSFEREMFQAVVKLTFEAIQNVYDHAARLPLDDGASLISYFALRYYSKIDAGHPDATGSLRTYLEHLPSACTRRRTDFIEVTVNDDGVGIAARQSLNSDIYWGPKTDEESAFRDALTAGSSVKLRALDSRVRGKPGEGFTFIDSALYSLRAFATLRTGRLLAVLDGSNDERPGFQLLPAELGYMPGTLLTVLIPILKDLPETLPLFPDE